MNRKYILLLLVLFNFCVAFGQFKSNSIGVCYLESDSSDSYSLSIELPFATLQNPKRYGLNTSVNYNGSIILFDKTGEIIKINSEQNFFLQNWCTNDGGDQYRPVLKMKVKKTDLKIPLKAIHKIQDICCFVLINSSEQKIYPTDKTHAKSIELIGDYNNDSKTDCFIWTAADPAQNCDGKPENNLRIILRIGKEDYSLRCCGP